MTRTTRTTLAAAVLTGLALTAAGCGGDDAPAHATHSMHASFDDADVAFASQMVPHHAQALAMVRLAQGRPLDPAVATLMGRIRDAQAPEIDEMTSWLQSWGHPVDDSSAGTGGMDSMAGMDSTGDAMPGMMTAAQMRRLADSGDAGFQRMWLRMMIRHHEGAIAMARTEIAHGKYPAALDLARSITTSQAQEIQRMKAMLQH
ncbi:MAG: DUF305 domain-containing protein [Nocardioides sp.]